MTDFSTLIYNLNHAILYLELIVAIMILGRKKIRREFDLRKAMNLKYLSAYFVGTLALAFVMWLIESYFEQRGSPFTTLTVTWALICGYVGELACAEAIGLLNRPNETTKPPIH